MAKKSVLIAEDDHYLLKMYQLGLQGHPDLRVTVASNGEKALEAIKKSPPDILLLDLLMPKMDGYGLLEELKKLEHDFPIIIMSNLSQQIDQQKCRAMGAKDYFIKSDMNLYQLADLVKRYI